MNHGEHSEKGQAHQWISLETDAPPAWFLWHIGSLRVPVEGDMLIHSEQAFQKVWT